MHLRIYALEPPSDLGVTRLIVRGGAPPSGWIRPDTHL